MTFEDARNKQLQKMDDVYIVLREILSDPGFNNPGYPKYKEAVEKFHDAMKGIMAVNSVEIEAKG
jgi:hypothetical protein